MIRLLIKLVKINLIELVENFMFIFVNFFFDLNIVVEVLVDDVVFVLIRILREGIV